MPIVIVLQLPSLVLPSMMVLLPTCDSVGIAARYLRGRERGVRVDIGESQFDTINDCSFGWALEERRNSERGNDF